MEHVHNPPPSAQAMSEDLAEAAESDATTSAPWAARRKDDSRLVAAARTELDSYTDLSVSGSLCA